MSALSPCQQPTVLFSIYQNNTWTISWWDDRPSEPAYYIEDCRIYTFLYLFLACFLAVITGIFKYITLIIPSTYNCVSFYCAPGLLLGNMGCRQITFFFSHMRIQGHLTQIFPTFPNPIVNLDFHMKMDPELSWVSNDR